MDICGSVMLQSSTLFPNRPQSNMAVLNLNFQSDIKITNDSSLKSSLTSENDMTATTSLLEGSIGVKLPQSKIKTAAQKYFA